MNGEKIENVCNSLELYSEIQGCSPRWELWGIVNKKHNYKSSLDVLAATIIIINDKLEKSIGFGRNFEANSLKENSA